MTSQNKKNKHKHSFSVNATLKNKISECKGFLEALKQMKKDKKEPTPYVEPSLRWYWL